MNTQDTNEKVVSPEKKARRKKGLTYLLLAVVCLVVSFIMYSAGIEGGIMLVIVNLAMIIFFVGGLIYLIGGFVGKG